MHAITDIWPVMKDEDLSGLVESIKANGQLVPAITWHGEIVDGRHRALACDIAGIQLKTKALPDEWEIRQVVAHVKALNDEP